MTTCAGSFFFFKEVATNVAAVVEKLAVAEVLSVDEGIHERYHTLRRQLHAQQDLLPVPINFLDSSCYSVETSRYRAVPSCRQVAMRRLLPSQCTSYYSLSLRNRNWPRPPRSYRLLCQAGRWVRRFLFLWREAGQTTGNWVKSITTKRLRLAKTLVEAASVFYTSLRLCVL